MKDLIEDNHVPNCEAYNTELTAIEKNKFEKDGTMGHLTNNMIRCIPQSQEQPHFSLAEDFIRQLSSYGHTRN